MAEMGNSTSDSSTSSDASIINSSINDGKTELLAQDVSQTSEQIEAAIKNADKLTGDGKEADSEKSPACTNKVTEGLDVIPTSGNDGSNEKTADPNNQGISTTEKEENINQSIMQSLETVTTNEKELLPMYSAEDKKNVPATPPATPTNSVDPPQFPSPNLDTTFILSSGDNVSNTPVAADNKTEILSKPATPSAETILAPILEAATIVNAVAGISISNPSTPVTLSTPSGGEPLPSLGVEISAETRGNGNVQTAPSTELGDDKPKDTRDEEIEFLRARVKALETELVAALSKPGTRNHALVETIKQQHEELLSKARGMLFDKTKIVKNQELQIEALNAQVASLKDVNSITKDLLEIRNSEIKHLEDRLSNMEARFKAEKERHILVLKRAETGQNINNDLKTEYEGQLKIFKDLREMYDQRVQALVKENQSLKECLVASKGQSTPST